MREKHNIALILCSVFGAAAIAAAVYIALSGVFGLGKGLRCLLLFLVALAVCSRELPLLWKRRGKDGTESWDRRSLLRLLYTFVTWIVMCLGICFWE